MSISGSQTETRDPSFECRDRDDRTCTGSRKRSKTRTCALCASITCVILAHFPISFAFSCHETCAIIRASTKFETRSKIYVRVTYENCKIFDASIQRMW